MTDFKKLEKFAKLLGVTVSQGEMEDGDAGLFIYDSKRPTIEMNLKKRKGPEDTLILLHELGHAIDWILKGRPPEKEIPQALLSSEDVGADQRRIVFEYEQRAVRNMALIWQLLDLKLPLWRLEFERRFDLWIAEHFLTHGVYPTKAQRRSFRKDLRRSINKKTVSNLSLI